jgi:predicted nucleic acid-binding protein
VTDLVVDASVVVKWVVDEPGTPQALALRRHRLYAPDLLAAECANVPWKKVRRNELTESEALFATRLLQRAAVELMPMRALLEPGLQDYSGVRSGSNRGNDEDSGRHHRVRDRGAVALGRR